MRGRFSTGPTKDEGQILYRIYRGGGAGTLQDLPRTSGRFSTEPTKDEGQILYRTYRG
jgi:hypothetical protein